MLSTQICGKVGFLSRRTPKGTGIAHPVITLGSRQICLAQACLGRAGGRGSEPGSVRHSPSGHGPVTRSAAGAGGRQGSLAPPWGPVLPRCCPRAHQGCLHPSLARCSPGPCRPRAPAAPGSHPAGAPFPGALPPCTVPWLQGCLPNVLKYSAHTDLQAAMVRSLTPQLLHTGGVKPARGRVSCGTEKFRALPSTCR